MIMDDTYLYDMINNKWNKLNFPATGSSPSARAAHASAKIEND